MPKAISTRPPLTHLRLKDRPQREHERAPRETRENGPYFVRQNGQVT